MANPLTERHRRSQLALRAQVVRQLLAIWPALKPAEVDRSWPAVETAVAALVTARRRDSADLAAVYYQALRTALGIGGQPTPILADEVDPELLAVSLRVTGPATIKRLTAAHVANAPDVALVRLSGAVARHVLDGGRETLIRSIGADRRARGWQRVTSGRACQFCTMLAGRGAVYGEESSTFASHDHCGCTAEPVFA